MKTNISIIIALSLMLVSCSNKSNNQQFVLQDSVKNPVPEWSKNCNIYEVNIRQYTPEGTFKAFEKHIDRLKQTGVDILWLMPIYPVGEKNRKGTLGSPYGVKDYTAVNPDYGTLDDLKAIVNKAHACGMHVILDWVANHTAWDNKWVSSNPEFYTKDSLGNSPIVPAGTDWFDTADLDYSCVELRKTMIDAMAFWIKNADIDGFRCDVAGMVPVDFWVDAVNQLYKIKPVFMLAEDEGPQVNAAFHMTYGWNFHHIINDIAQGKKSAEELEKYFNEDAKKFKPEDYKMMFTSNHDENTWNKSEYQRMGDAAQTMAVLCYTVPGMPLIYSGQEAAMDKSLRFFDKDTIDFSNCKLQQFYADLNNLKHNNKPLWNGIYGGNLKFISSDNKNISIFSREKDNEKIICIFNLSNKTQEVKCELSGDYTNLLTNEKVTLLPDKAISLNAWNYFIFK